MAVEPCGCSWIRDILIKYGNDINYEHSELYTGQSDDEWFKVLDN